MGAVKEEAVRPYAKGTGGDRGEFKLRPEQ